jgi:hypothetical protein
MSQAPPAREFDGTFACIAAAWAAHEAEWRSFLLHRLPDRPSTEDLLHDAEDAAIQRACDLKGLTQREFAERHA